ncbi:hypothetical protein RclHR1_00380042 [Rhizophagus clarus]|uniref:Ubiquitin-like domain-containing protein n=1 Tax=Rhizophagus clarus TaxID=94130 RepID=A0A2Z6RDR7_9GLOM|nr:hypothetical protein RclHR1_00380042 [Rhizophagus clarus]GET01483.1 hypothetical protein GLOIN_2v1789598 [Rhizophagus clarus]
MWVLLEGDSNPIRIESDISLVVDLADFKHILRNELIKLKNIKERDIVFFTYHDLDTSLPPDTKLQPLADNTTKNEPLIVKYLSQV